MGNVTRAWSGDASTDRQPTVTGRDIEVPAAAGDAGGAGDAADHMRNAGPGWYYDPDDEAIYRYWDGERWTDHRADTVMAEIPG
jgi:hypothetical protein